MEEKSDSMVPPPRVRIFECAHDGIQELFNRDSSKATKPMDERNFPKSFWIPPTKDHKNYNELSGENLQDGFSISHRKSNSSPSCIGTNPVYLPESIDHNRQKSLDTTQNLARVSKVASLGCSSGISSHGNRGSFQYPDVRQPDSLTSPICELPPEFQMAINENKQVYFLNHETKQTTWFDPRIPPEEQKWGMTIEELDQIHINYARFHKISTHSLEGHRQMPASPMSVLSPMDSMSCGSCCSTLPGSPGNPPTAAGGGGAGACVRPSSVPRMQHPAAFGMSHVAPQPRAAPMNLLPPQSSKQQQLPPRQGHQQPISHAKSASQPAPMSVSAMAGICSDSCMAGGGGGGGGGGGAGSGGLGGVSMCYGLGPSSSLTRLHHPSYAGGGGVAPLQANSFGHLAQDMEELSLSRSSGETTLPHLQQMFCNTPLLPLISQPPPHSGPGEYGQQGHQAATMTSSQQQQQQAASAQHSHQSSMDSGVGPSVAGGHSIPSANQTPEHIKVSCFDSSMDNCEMGPDFLSYSGECCASLDYCVPESLPQHQLSSLPGMTEMTRSQQG